MDEQSLQRIIRRPEIEQLAAQIIASRRSKLTRIAYTSDFQRWIAFCANHGIDPAVPLLPHAVMYRETLLTVYGNASVKRMLATVCLVYRACAASGLVLRNPFDMTLLPRPQVAREGVTPLVPADDAEQIMALAAVDDSPRGRRDHAILRVLYDTGLRRESVATLPRADIFTGQMLVVLKGGKTKLKTLPETALRAVERWLQVAPKSSYLFPAARGEGGHLDLATINRIVASRARLAGVPHVHPHQFRATYITDAIVAGNPTHEVQGDVGHASGDTTDLYDRHRRGDHVADSVAAWRQKRPR